VSQELLLTPTPSHSADGRRAASFPRGSTSSPARAERRADRTVEQAHSGRRRAARGSADGRDRPL